MSERVVRAAAVLLTALYVAALAIGWVSAAPAGHEGITRTHDPQEEAARALGGVPIGAVAPGSPAERAGIAAGDVLLAVDGVSPSAAHDLFHGQRAGDLEWVRVRHADGRAAIYELRLVSRLAIWPVVLEMTAASLAGLLVVGMAAFVALARPREPAGPLLLLFAFSMGLLSISDIWHWGLSAAWLAMAFDLFTSGMMLVGGVALLHLFLVFPGRRPAPWRWLAPLYALAVLVLAATLVTGIWGLAFPPALLVLAAAFATLARSWRRAPSGVARAQLKWVVWGLGAALAGALFGAAFPAATGGRAQAVVPIVSAAAFAVFPLSIGVAALRYRLWEIDLLIGRTLLYGALTASVAGIYVLVVGGLGALLQASGSLGLSLVATGLVALLIEPLRRRLQRWVNRLLYGERDEPYAVLSRLSQRLEVALAPEMVPPTIVRTVREALHLPYAALWLEQDGGLALAAESGVATGALEAFPVVHQGTLLAELRLGQRGPGEGFGPADRHLLGHLTRRTGAALEAARLAAELRRARQRLVAVREEEQRRLRRDLHDGLGPTLAAQTLKVGVARGLLRRDAAAADARLAELEEGLADALADVRRLVYGLRPPALDDLGLAAAVRQAAAGLAEGLGAPCVEVEAPERLPPLPAAVEVAAFRIVQEALTNVVRHANARRCRIGLRLVDGALEVEVADDGRGLEPARRAGVGLASMRERATELGGSYVVEGIDGGGTRVVARLPVGMDEPIERTRI
jgi:signal transduction histidine kinase